MSVENRAKGTAPRLRRFALVVAVLIGTPLLVVAGVIGGTGSFYLVSVAIMALALGVFFFSFERRRPAARELAVLAVMVALAVASRVVFIGIPFFKPMAAIIMIAGLAFGARSGFLVGAMAVLASNFMFGQGPWTPWQMLAYGFAGLVAGLLCGKVAPYRGKLGMPALVGLGIGGGLFVLCVVGPILDTCTLLTAVSVITPEAAFAVYLAGVPVNAVQAIATTVTLLLLARPLLQKLDRVRVKYGMTAQAGYDAL